MTASNVNTDKNAVTTVPCISTETNGVNSTVRYGVKHGKVNSGAG